MEILKGLYTGFSEASFLELILVALAAVLARACFLHRYAVIRRAWFNDLIKGVDEAVQAASKVGDWEGDGHKALREQFDTFRMDQEARILRLQKENAELEIRLEAAKRSAKH